MDIVVESAEKAPAAPPDDASFIHHDEVSEVVEKAQVELESNNQNGKGHSNGDDYKSNSADYASYNPDTDVTKQEFEPPTDDIIVDEDVTAHRFRKDTDIKEYMQSGKYNKPWDNPFLCYVRNTLNDRASRANALAKKGFRSAVGGVHAVYHTLYGWVYRKK